MLQSTVKATLPVGSAGQIYKSEHSFLNTVERLAQTDVTVGTFVQKGTLENEVIEASGVAITAGIVGVVVKNELKPSVANTAIIAKGDNVTVVTEGNIYIATSLAATQGQYVFLKTADGSLAFGNTATLADHTYTGFRVDIGNATATAGVVGITSSRA
jgi:hypothetical protein